MITYTYRDATKKIIPEEAKTFSLAKYMTDTCGDNERCMQFIGTKMPDGSYMYYLMYEKAKEKFAKNEN